MVCALGSTATTRPSIGKRRSAAAGFSDLQPKMHISNREDRKMRGSKLHLRKQCKCQRLGARGFKLSLANTVRHPCKPWRPSRIENGGEVVTVLIRPQSDSARRIKGEFDGSARVAIEY